VSDIGSLGFDLQHHSEVEIAHAVAILRTVNPQMFEWLSRVLGATTDAIAVDPVPERGTDGLRATEGLSSLTVTTTSLPPGAAPPPETIHEG
jgi:hypothetical protein